MIEIVGLTKRFERRGIEHIALDNVSLTIEDGDVFGIIGESGAGKSTLVRCINALERPSSGHVFIDGNDTAQMTRKELRHLRSEVCMIFQNFGLFAQRNVLRNVVFPLELAHVPRRERETRAKELLEIVGLSGKEKSYPSELSGGQKQRVAIARALAPNPRVILCDEATSALDSRTTIQILDLLKDINQRLGVTLVVITHALSVAEEICNRIAVIDDGRIVEQGLTSEVFTHPQSEITRELLGHHKV